MACRRFMSAKRAGFRKGTTCPKHPERLASFAEYSVKPIVPACDICFTEEQLDEARGWSVRVLELEARLDRLHRQKS